MCDYVKPESDGEVHEILWLVADRDYSWLCLANLTLIPLFPGGKKSLRINVFFTAFMYIFFTQDKLNREHVSTPPGDTVDNVLLCAVRTRRTNQVDLNSHI